MAANPAAFFILLVKCEVNRSDVGAYGLPQTRWRGEDDGGNDSLAGSVGMAQQGSCSAGGRVGTAPSGHRGGDGVLGAGVNLRHVLGHRVAKVASFLVSLPSGFKAGGVVPGISPQQSGFRLRY